MVKWKDAVCAAGSGDQTAHRLRPFKERRAMRRCGVLLPVFSLPSKYGIGCFSREAYEFIDRLQEAGQSCWQILPLGPTSYGDSPYQSFSTFAGNPYYIDPQDLLDRGWITKRQCDGYDFGDDPEKIDYAKMFESRFFKNNFTCTSF